MYEGDRYGNIFLRGDPTETGGRYVVEDSRWEPTHEGGGYLKDYSGRDITTYDVGTWRIL